MNILQEIHNDAKLGMRDCVKHNSRKIITIAFTLGIFFTISFYYTGVGYFDKIYSESPVVFAFVVAGIQSVVAMLITQFLILYLLSFTKSTTLRIFHGYGKFNTNSMLHDDLAPIEFAKRTDKHIFKRLLKKLKPIFNALRDDLFNELHTNQKKNDQRFERLEQEKIQHSENDRTSFNYINQLEGDLRKSNFILRAKNQNLKKENKELDNELKIWRKVASDFTFKTNFIRKTLDKAQTRLDDFFQ